MSDEDGALGGEETEDGDGKTPGKKIVLLAGIGVVLLLLIGGGAFFFLSGGEEEEQQVEHEELKDDGPPAVAIYHPMDDLMVNLASSSGQQSYLKLKVELELQKQEDVAAIQQLMPRIYDSFQIYLRELRIEDVSGSAGMYRLKEELMRRVNKAAAPVQVTAILFREMLVQ